MKVSVPITTYNHERYIARAIEGALMQRTDFDYEILVGEDCSTDRTRDIVTEFQRRFPGRVRALLHEQNLGLKGKRNFGRTLGGARGNMLPCSKATTTGHRLTNCKNRSNIWTA